MVPFLHKEYFHKRTAFVAISFCSGILIQPVQALTTINNNYTISRDQTGEPLEPFLFRLDPSPAGQYDVSNFASLQSAGTGQAIFSLSANSNLILNNRGVLSSGLNSGSVIRAYGGTFTINNYEDIESASSDFVIDIQGSSSGAINNFGVINGKQLIRSSAPFNGTILNEGTLNAGAGTVIDFTVGSALNLENYGLIRGDIKGSPDVSDSFALKDGVFSGTVTSVEQVSNSGQSRVSGTFTDTLQFRNSGELYTDGLILNGTSYIQDANSSLIVSLSEDNLTQPVITTGSASFSPGSTLSLEPDVYVLTREGTASYKALLSSSPIVNKDQLTVTGSLFFDNISITGNNQEVDITLEAKDIDQVIAESGLADDAEEAYSEALENVIEVLEKPEKSLVTTGELEKWLSALTGITDHEQLAKTAKELKPSTNGSVAFLPMQLTQTIQQQLSRQAAIRFSALSYGDSGNTAENRLWGQAYYSASHYKKQRKKDGTQIRGYEAASDGLIIGYDQQWSEDFLAGAAFSYGNSQTEKNNSPDRLNIQSYLLSLYGLKRWSDWSLTSVFSAGIHKNTHQRFYEVATLDSAKGRFDSRFHGFSLLLGKTLRFADWFISPQTSLNYQALSTERYTETGTLNYHYASGSYKQLELGVGIDAEKFQLIGKHLLKWQFSGFARHDVKAKAYRVKTAYAFINQAPWFTSEGASPDKNHFEVKAGLNYSISEQMELELSFIHNWSEAWRSNSGYLRLEYNF